MTFAVLHMLRKQPVERDSFMSSERGIEIWTCSKISDIFLDIGKLTKSENQCNTFDFCFDHLKLTILNCSLKRKGLKKVPHQIFQFCKSYDKKKALLLSVHFSVHENAFNDI